MANLSQSISDVVKLKNELASSPVALTEALNKDIDYGTERLIALIGASDGLQLTGDRRRNIRHFANTMFNVMRGGIFDENYQIDKADFMAYIDRANHKVFFKKQGLMSSWPDRFDLFYLKVAIQADDDLNFKRWHRWAAALWSVNKEIAPNRGDDAAGFSHAIAGAWPGRSHRLVNFADQVRL